MNARQFTIALPPGLKLLNANQKIHYRQRAEYVRALRGAAIRNSERAGGHIDGSVHIPVHELHGRIGEVPDGTVWVHCAGGMRAAIAASLLDAAGRDVVAVDDGFDAAAEAGLPLARPDGTG
jgi:rhodanese-related sulfurtransferase